MPSRFFDLPFADDDLVLVFFVILFVVVVVVSSSSISSRASSSSTVLSFSISGEGFLRFSFWVSWCCVNSEKLNKRY